MKVFWREREKGRTGPIRNPKNGAEKLSLAYGKGAERRGRVPGSIRRGRTFAKRDFSGGEKVHRYKPKGGVFLQPVVKEFQPGRWFEPRAEIRCRTLGKADRKPAFCGGVGAIRREGGRRRHVAGAGRGKTAPADAASSGSGRGAKNAVRSRSGQEARRKCRFAGKNREDCKRNENARKYETDVPARRKQGADDSPSLVSEGRFRKGKKDEGCRCCEKQKNAGKGRKRKAQGWKDLREQRLLRRGGYNPKTAVRCGRRSRGAGRKVLRKREGATTCEQKKRMRARVFANERKRACVYAFAQKERDVCEFLCSFGAVFLFENSFSTGQSPFHQDEKAHKRRRIVFFGLERSWAKKPCAFGSEGVLAACSRLRIKTRKPPRGAVGSRKAALRGACAGEESGAERRQESRKEGEQKEKPVGDPTGFENENRKLIS